MTRGCKWDPSADATTVDPPNNTDNSGALDTDRMDDVMMYLIEQGVSTENDLITSGSPQQRALEFIAIDDDISLDVPTGDIGSPEGYEFITRYILTVLYYSTAGARWTFELNFLQPKSVCQWYNNLNYVDNSTEFRGVFCDEETDEILALYLSKSRDLELDWALSELNSPTKLVLRNAL